jgi:hypothetical protein
LLKRFHLFALKLGVGHQALLTEEKCRCDKLLGNLGALGLHPNLSLELSNLSIYARDHIGQSALLRPAALLFRHYLFVEMIFLTIQALEHINIDVPPIRGDLTCFHR